MLCCVVLCCVVLCCVVLCCVVLCCVVLCCVVLCCVVLYCIVLYIVLQLAFVENLNGPQLFESMYAEDAEGQKLGKMPGVSEMLDIYPCHSRILIGVLFSACLHNSSFVMLELNKL